MRRPCDATRRYTEEGFRGLAYSGPTVTAPKRPRTHMYVDGLNLYYGMMKRSPRGRKWLNFEALARRLFPNEDVAEIHYFTARIKELDDPDAPNRQRMYLEALGFLPSLTIHYGFFRIDKKMRKLVTPPEEGSPFVEVLNPEEKGSDVNLATRLVADTARGVCAKAILLSNDADLAAPHRAARHEFGAETVLLHPSSRPAQVLRREGDPHTVMKLYGSVLMQCQLSEQVQVADRTVTKPPGW